MMKKANLLYILLFCVIATTASAQVNFRPGYVITNSMDTIVGKIDYRSDSRMCNSCTFKNNELGKVRYSPNDIYGYRFKEDRFFVTTIIDGNKVFTEQIINGALSIYYYCDRYGITYFFKKENGTLNKMNYKENMVYFDGTGRASDGKYYSFANDSVHGDFKIQSMDFIVMLLDSLNDVPAIAPDVLKIDKPNHFELLNLAKKYHVLKNDNEDYVVYNDLHKVSDYEFSIGWIDFNYPKFKQPDIYTMYSFRGFTSLAKRMLFLGYGIQYIPVKFYNLNYKVVRVPLSVRYQYQGKYVKPEIALGTNLYYMINDGDNFFIQDFVPSYRIGISVRLYKSVHMNCNIEGDLLLDSYYNNSATAIFSSAFNCGLLLSL